MPDLELFLVAETYVVDQSTNRLSVINILDTMPVPAQHIVPQLAIVASWKIHDDDKGKDFQQTIRMTVLGQPVNEHRANFTAAHLRHRLLLHVYRMRVQHALAGRAG